MADSQEQILYDLLVHAEWPQEPEILNKAEQELWVQRGPLILKLWRLIQSSGSYLLQNVKSQFRYQTSFGCPPLPLVDLINSLISWDLALSEDGHMLAVLQEKCIEIRSLKDSFSSVVSRCVVENDPFPQWRHLAWSQCNSFFAYSTSFGDIFVYDVSCSHIDTITQARNVGINIPVGFSHAVASLFFGQAENENSGTCSLYAVTYLGQLRKFDVSDGGISEVHSCSFSSHYPNGVSCAVLSQKHNLLFVGGYSRNGQSERKDDVYGSQYGISIWRLLSEFPYYSLIEDRGLGFKKLTGNELFRNFVKMRRLNKSGNLELGVLKMSLSPAKDTLFSLHQNGTLALWHVPSMKLLKSWDKSEQPKAEGSDLHLNFSRPRKRKQGEELAENVIGINWWSDENLILVKGTGATTISSKDSLENRLGLSPEMFDPWPRISEAVGGQFLVLECEKTVTTDGEDVRNETDEESRWLDKGSDDEQSFVEKTKEILKQSLYFFTESERFQPPPKKPKLLQQVYRLVALKSTTPEELYSRKINLEEYGEALTLAQRFDLNTDLVYQCQWKRSPVTVISIKDYLSKIKDRFWVLNECLQRVPDDIDAALHLMKYGLAGTSREILKQIDLAENLPFVIPEDEAVPSDGLTHDDGTLQSLSGKQSELCKIRWQIVQYLYRLSTYEVILGGPVRSKEHYRPEFFQGFRCCNILHQAVTYAQASNADALWYLFTYHGEELLPHRLAILSNFPETATPSDYQDLLPEIWTQNQRMEVRPWKQASHSAKDWVQDEKVFAQFRKSLEEEDPDSFLYEEQPQLLEFRAKESVDLVTKWYIKRAHWIEELSLQVDNALQLVKIGQKRGVKDLNSLEEDLVTLEVLIYEVQIFPPITLARYEELSNLSRLRLLLSKSTEDTFIHDFRRWAMPFFNRVQQRSGDVKNKLLTEYMVDVAKTDLTFPLKIFENSTPETEQKIIANTKQLLKLALDSIFVCKRDDQLEIAFSIIECLPNRKKDSTDDEEDELQDRIDDVEKLLRGAEILEYNGCQKTVSFLRDNQKNESVARDILADIIKQACIREKPVTSEEWNRLLKQVLQLRDEVFSVLSQADCYQIFVSGLLHSGKREYISLASDLISNRLDPGPGTCTSERKTTDVSKVYRVPYDASVKLVLDASIEYFNAASSLMDPSMDMARHSLSLIQDKPVKIQEELNLIASLALLDDFGINLLPVQVRLHENPLDLVQQAARSKPSSYKDKEKLLRLGRLLQIHGSNEKETKGKVLVVIAESSLVKSDYVYAQLICEEIMSMAYEPGWLVCRHLGESEDYFNYSARAILIDFALTYCNPEAIETLLLKRNLLETQIIYSKLSEYHRDDEMIDEEDGQSQSIVGRTQGHITSTTKALFSASFWKNTVSWITLAKDKSDEVDIRNQDSSSSVDDFQRLWHHFYDSVYSGIAESPIQQSVSPGQSVQELSLPPSSKLYITWMLLRSQKLAECRTEGSVLEASSEALVELAEQELQHDTMMALAYLFSLQEVEDATSLFDKYFGSSLVLQLATYLCALQLCAKTQDHKRLSKLYSKPAIDTVREALKTLTTDSGDLLQSKEFLMMEKYMLQLSEVVQAKTFMDIDKGIDIYRFTTDSDYKKETILGLAMTVEENVIKISRNLAEKYAIPVWEVVCAHIEFLFTDSGLPVKDIQDRLANLSSVDTLKANKDLVLEKMRLYVYPDLSGTDHALLLALFTFLQGSCGGLEVLQGEMDIQSSIKFLKKLKGVAPGIDYKALIHSGNPIPIIEPFLNDSNIQQIAKLAANIPWKETGTFLPASAVYCAHIKRSFWNLDKKQQATKGNWNHQFEQCQRVFAKLSVSDLISFVDNITFSQQAIDNLPFEVRLNITSRSLKYARQQRGQESKKGSGTSCEANDDNMSYANAVSHFEQSLSHLQSLQDDTFMEFFQSDRETMRNYAREFDLSRSEPEKVSALVIRMFTECQEPERVQAVLSLAEKQTPQTLSVESCFKESLTSLLHKLQSSSQSMDLIQRIEALISIIQGHIEKGGNLVHQEDVLDVVRPFCAKVEVHPTLKTNVLKLLEKSFQLKGEDIFLLVCYQTDAIVSSQWNRKILPNEVESDERRHQLFLELLNDSDRIEKFTALGLLLSAWPILAATELSEEKPEINPWVLLLERVIDIGEDKSAFSMLTQAKKSVTFGSECYTCLYNKLLDRNRIISGVKLALISGDDKCLAKAFDDLATVKGTEEGDTELFNLVLKEKALHRLTKTPLYKHCLTYILQNTSCAEEGYDRLSDALAQLSQNGLLAEAGALLARYRKLPTSFRTINNSLSVIRGWLRR